MKFIQDVDRERYENFVMHHPSKSHFMQSSAWGDFNQVQRGLKALYTGLEDDNGNLVAAAMLTERKPAFFPPYLYSPRGYVLDYTDSTLLAAFTKEIKSFAKSRGDMFVCIDPDIERRAIKEDGSYAEGGFDNSPLVEELLSLGYRHMGWNMGFEGREPRFTFRIDLTREQTAIEKSFTGNVMKNIKKSHHYALNIHEGGSEDIPTFFDMVTKTSDRDRFFAYDLEYYQNFYDSLAKNHMAHLYIGEVDPSSTVELLKQELEDTLAKREKLKKEGPLNESRETEARLLREIQLFTQYAQEYTSPVTVSTHLVVRYGDKAWAVHAGSAGIMNETFCNNRVYYEKLMAQKQAGCKFLDMFGTIGNPETNTDFGSVHSFKRQWGGRYIEFIGQFDLVCNSFWYFLYVRVRPVYQHALARFKQISYKIKCLIQK